MIKNLNLYCNYLVDYFSSIIKKITIIALITGCLYVVIINSRPLFLTNVYTDIVGGFFHHRYFAQGWLGMIKCTAITTVISILLGGFFGLFFPLILWPYKTTKYVFLQIVNLIRAVPPLVSIPFFLCIFAGHGNIPSLAAAFSYTFLVSVMYACANIETNETRYDSIAALHQVQGFKRSYFIRLPAALPGYLTHLRIVLSLTLGIVIVAEYFQDNGLGFALRISQNKHDIVTVISTIMISIVLFIVIEIGISCLLPLIRSYHIIHWKFPALQHLYFIGVIFSVSRSALCYFCNFIRSLFRKIISVKNLFTVTPMPYWTAIQIVAACCTITGLYLVVSQLREQRIAQAWQILSGAAGKRGEAGRLPAVEHLTKSHRYLTGADLSMGHYQSATISAGLLESVSFDEATLNNIHFVDGNLFRAKFRGAKIINTKFSNCNIWNADFGKSADITDSEFSNKITLPYSNKASAEQIIFSDSRLRNIKFAHVSLSGANFSRVKGTDIIFSECVLHGCNFQGAGLTQSEFIIAKTNQATSFASADLEGSKFIKSELISCDFSRANLKNVVFNESTLSAVKFTGTDLRRARFDFANEMVDADFDRMIKDIRFANIFEVDAPMSFIKWARKRGAVTEPNTIRWEERLRNVRLFRR